MIIRAVTFLSVIGCAHLLSHGGQVRSVYREIFRSIKGHSHYKSSR